MANIQVYRDEADGDLFPRLCMKCGADADHDVRQTFAWMPPWVIIFIFCGLLPFLIVVMITRWTMRVTCPMCDKHKNHWRNRKLFVWLGLLTLIGSGIAEAALFEEIPKDAQPIAIGVIVFGGFIWLIAAAILSTSAIRAGRIDEDGIQLVHVHKDFRDAWEELQPEPLPRKKKKRRLRRDEDEDDDYDDRDR